MRAYGCYCCISLRIGVILMPNCLYFNSLCRNSSGNSPTARNKSHKWFILTMKDLSIFQLAIIIVQISIKSLNPHLIATEFALSRGVCAFTIMISFRNGKPLQPRRAKMKMTLLLNGLIYLALLSALIEKMRKWHGSMFVLLIEL